MDDSKLRLVISEYSATGEGVTVAMLVSRGNDVELFKLMLNIFPYFGLGAEVVDIENIPPEIKAHVPDTVMKMLETQPNIQFTWNSMFHANTS